MFRSTESPLVLLVEDSPESARLIERAVADSVQLKIVGTLAGARDALAAQRPDAILLDLCLPDGQGFELCNELRGEATTEHLPILFLTARADTAAKLAAFSLGADDYLVKPFHPLELRARVNALLRRARANAPQRECLRVGDLVIDLSKLIVALAGPGSREPIALTAHEFRLLCHLATHEGRVFSRSDLLAAVWGGTIVGPRTVDSHLSNLRRKLGSCGHYLRTVRGAGYQLQVEPASTQQAIDGDFSTETGPGAHSDEPMSRSRTSEGNRRNNR